MKDLKRMALFATVVQRESMSAAARTLGMSPSAVSQQLRQLEREAGVTLLHRSTRQLTLTDAGQRFYLHCAALCEAAERAQAELDAERATPSGTLRLATTVGFGRHIERALGAWLQTHTALRLHLMVNDQPVDLIQARVDLAIRYGTLADSNWVAKRLGHMRTWLCAAPAWVQTHALPTHPRQLSGQHWLSLLPKDREAAGDRIVQRPWIHRDGFDDWTPDLLPRFTSNNQLSLQQMCTHGLGWALLSSMDVAQLVADGKLLRLLPDWDVGGLDIWALTPQRQTQAAKVRQAIALLQAYLAHLPGVDA